jgi:hypothetical protein
MTSCVASIRILCLLGSLAGTNAASADPVATPAIDRTATVSVGDAMLDQGEVKTIPGLMLDEPVHILSRTFSAGFYPLIREDGDYSYHSFLAGKTPIDGLGAATNIASIQSLRADKHKQELCAINRPQVRMLAFGLKTCATHAFRRIDRPESGGSHRTLIYGGRTGTTIHVGYHESGGGILRPDFATEAAYDLSTSDTIAYKGARLRVLHADSQSITFVVLAGFDGPPR